MIFLPEHCELILAGLKTQTRRLVKSYEQLEAAQMIVAPYHRIRFIVGQTYAIQPGRGKRSIGRIRIMAIRQERLQDITAGACVREGVPRMSMANYERDAAYYWSSFAATWDQINRKGTRWADDPEVWVLTFEVVK